MPKSCAFWILSQDKILRFANSSENSGALSVLCGVGMNVRHMGHFPRVGEASSYRASEEYLWRRLILLR
ncbi:hypothetical protein TNCV_2377061 [Trichonephila clavipes]|nr:hypothetical protein TNCV_2377061 [Trichonephila clavipes]